jgi:hypothetical protein
MMLYPVNFQTAILPKLYVSDFACHIFVFLNLFYHWNGRKDSFFYLQKEEFHHIKIILTDWPADIFGDSTYKGNFAA